MSPADRKKRRPRSKRLTVKTAPRARRVVREPERVAQATLDALPDHIAILDESGLILAVNRAWRSFAEANHRPPVSVCEDANYLAVCDAARGSDADTAAAFAAGIRAVLGGERPDFTHEYPCHSPTARRWFVGRVTRFAGDGPARLVLTHVNITERKLVEEALRQNEARYRAVVEDQTEVIFRFKADGTITFVNEVYCRFFGKTRIELLGCNWRPQAFVDDVREVEDQLRTLSPSTPIVVVENRVLSRSGDVRWMQFVNHGFYDPSGLLVEIQAVGRDITDRKQVEVELRASHEQLRALATHLQAVREEERTRLAREMHDVLAQELTRLKIDLVWLERRLAKSADGATEGLVARVAEMSQVADTAIQFVQRTATGLRPAVLDSLGLCAAVEWQAKDFQAHSGIACQVSVTEVEPPVSRNVATATFRILQESLTNVVRHAYATRVDVSLLQEADQLVLRVVDNGCGIRPKALSNPLSIGLAGMRERSLLLGGKFEIQSQLGSGTTIEMRLPLTPARATPDPTP